jgi:aspartyl-tRNA(Asn)/glutamyl-tRNA(Gln) amidotransferase subunit C
MTISAAEVERIARLAELAVAPEELAALTEQLDRIVGFVAQLSVTAAGPADGGAVIGPPETPLRPDVVVPRDPAVRPADLAPEFVDGFFVVPRLGAPEDQ